MQEQLRNLQCIQASVAAFDAILESARYGGDSNQAEEQLRTSLISKQLDGLLLPVSNLGWKLRPVQEQLGLNGVCCSFDGGKRLLHEAKNWCTQWDVKSPELLELGLLKEANPPAPYDTHPGTLR